MISTISADAMRRDAIPSRIENPYALLARATIEPTILLTTFYQAKW